MDLIEKLRALGFENVAAMPDNARRGVTVYRIRTSKGFTYERFASEADVDAWAINHRPE